MFGDVHRFLHDSGAVAGAPATAQQLADFERASGLSLTDEIRELYSTCNGARIGRLNFSILTLDEVLPYKHFFKSELGFFPFTDENDFNPYAVCCAGPLRGWVVHLMHDDDPSVDFRNLRTFLDAIAAMPPEGPPEDQRHLVVPELAALPRIRTPQDVATGLATLKLAEGIEDDGFALWVIRFGLSLLTENELPEFHRLFERDWMTRRTAREELALIDHPIARKALSDYEGEIRDFTRQCSEILGAASVNVEAVESDAIKLMPGPVHLNMEAWYDRRRQADFANEFVAYAKNASARKAQQRT